MTFLEVLQDVYRRTNKPTTPESDTQARIKAFVNQRHRTLLTMPGMDQLRDSSSTIVSVAGTARVALPQAATRIRAIYESTTNRRLIEQSMDWLRTMNPQQDSGTPTHYIPRGYEPVAVQPSDASALWVTSSSASDISTVYIQGIRTGGILGSASQTMTGTTPVQIGTITDWVEITKFYVATAAVGAITLTEDSSVGTELAQITMGRLRPYYFVVLLWPTPASVISYACDFTREILDLVHDTDEPLLPTDYHDLLSLGGRMDEYEKTDDTRLSIARREYQQKYDSFLFFLHGRASQRLIPRTVSGCVSFDDVVVS